MNKAELVRKSCAYVVKNSEHVSINPENIKSFASTLYNDL